MVSVWVGASGRVETNGKYDKYFMHMCKNIIMKLVEVVKKEGQRR
jgi:hypothetical protein